jgi:hypothetical protein
MYARNRQERIKTISQSTHVLLARKKNFNIPLLKILWWIIDHSSLLLIFVIVSTTIMGSKWIWQSFVNVIWLFPYFKIQAQRMGQSFHIHWAIQMVLYPISEVLNILKMDSQNRSQTSVPNHWGLRFSLLVLHSKYLKTGNKGHVSGF